MREDEWKEMEAEGLEYLSSGDDVLSEMPRLNSFRAYVDALLATGELTQDDARHAVVFFNVENFKHYNQVYGYPAGDVFLRHMAAAILNAFPRDYVAHLTADQFVLLTRLDAVEEGVREVRAVFRREHKDSSIWLRAGYYALTAHDSDTGIACDRAKPEEQVRFSDLYHVRLPRAELKKHWALLVDDTPTNLFLLETICQSVGLPYRTAENGRAALELCQQQHFDLVFMDIQMPIMDGYTAIREIRKLPDSATTVIVALTASAFQEDVEKALGAGSTGFIPKPFERDQLLLCIADALGVAPERELRTADEEFSESPEATTIRRMHDFMREQYRLSLGEIKMILAQTLADWKPLLDNLATYAAQGNAEATNTILHRLKGQLAAIGLLDHSEQTVTMMEAFRSGNTAKGQAMVVAFNQSLTRIFKALENDVTLPQ